MGRVYDGIDEHQRQWIASQDLFFVGTAPLAGDGHVNVSPKGPIGSLAVLDARTVAYLDVVGQRHRDDRPPARERAHRDHALRLRRPARILRLHGRGRVVYPGSAEFEELLSEADFTQPEVPESRRSIVVVDVTRVSDSCGYGVPLMDYRGEREHQAKASAKRIRVHGPGAYEDYKAKKNAHSIDGLPGVG